MLDYVSGAGMIRLMTTLQSNRSERKLSLVTAHALMSAQARQPCVFCV